MRRQAGKERSLSRILAAGTARILREGLEGAAIAQVMHDAGLTHGAFYAHFTDKESLLRACFSHGLCANRARWVGPPRSESFADRLRRLAKRYLTAAHRDSLETSCPLAALASDAARSTEEFRVLYEIEFKRTLEAVLGEDPATRENPGRRAKALAFLALCQGGIQLARAVADEAFSREILDACRTFLDVNLDDEALPTPAPLGS